ncbi:MAG: response regulator transcription factor [Clostridia bacterium]|nr:response regulator transcription factor [Clostridia bacterium]
MHIYDEIFSTSPFGVLVVNCKSKTLAIEKSNRYIDRLVGNDINCFNGSHILDRCIDEKKNITETVALRNQRGEILYHSLNCIPINRNGNIEQIFCTAVPNDNTNNIIDSFSKLLTPRELQILQLVLEGYTNKYIGISLKISEGTVKKIIYNAYKKLGISSRIELAKMFIH